MNRIAILVLTGFMFRAVATAAPSTVADQNLARYLEAELRRISGRCLDNEMLQSWQSQREEYRRQLKEMLGLWPMPERADLNPVITGRIEKPEFTVEKLQFQALPHLYVTANLYLPRSVARPAPAVLYECGHARSVTNGVSMGNKAVYQTDGAWYARNGYVCLVLDTVLAGEIPGIHTGTRDHGLWWWNSRGYTPAGVEAWFGIRALDYLCTRPEVDTNRFGITGHSGGGAYSWMVAALDDRIKAAAPMAGMADIQSHILDGVVDSHCDCNFFINYYRWDFPQVAALVAPRPLLIGGTDNDRLFRLESTDRIHDKLRRVYGLFDATSKLGLIIAPGPHDEVPEMQLAVMRWFNRFLKGAETPVEDVPKRFFSPQELKVFATLPADAINTNIADSFVPMATGTAARGPDIRATLREKVFAGWPAENPVVAPRAIFSAERESVRLTAWEFESQPHVPLRFYVIEDAAKPSSTLRLDVLDARRWTNWLAAAGSVFTAELATELAGRNPGASTNRFEALRSAVNTKGEALVFFAPRGIGWTQWSGDEKALTRIRRRFMLLGQTLEGMRVWDIGQAVKAVRGVPGLNQLALTVHAEGTMAVNVLYAALFDARIAHLDLAAMPKSQLEGPDYLGVLKVTDIPDVLALAKKNIEVEAR